MGSVRRSLVPLAYLSGCVVMDAERAGGRVSVRGQTPYFVDLSQPKISYKLSLMRVLASAKSALAHNAFTLF